MKRELSNANRVARTALLIALIEAAKLSLASLPNIELTSFFIVVFTLYFGKDVLFAIPAFTVIEIIVFGFDIMWVLAYLYVWYVLYLAVKLLGRSKSVLTLSLISGFFGLFFGFLCSFPYLFITTGTNPSASLSSAIAWWIAGIPFDVIHGVSNFIIMLVLFLPVSKIVERSMARNS